MTDTALSPAYVAAAPATRVRGYWRTVGHRLRYDYVTLFFLAVILMIDRFVLAARPSIVLPVLAVRVLIDRFLLPISCPAVRLTLLK